MTIAAPFAHLGGMLATDLVQVADLAADPSVLDRGWWAVVGTFEGELTGYRFDRVVAADLPPPTGSWPDPAPEGWATSLNREEYLAGVRRIREHIEAGDVYQVNLCRMLTAPLSPTADPLVLAHRLSAGNPAPWRGVLHMGGRWIVSASPELFLSRDGDRRSEEHTSELQSRLHLVCRLLLDKKKQDQGAEDDVGERVAALSARGPAVRRRRPGVLQR